MSLKEVMKDLAEVKEVLRDLEKAGFKTSVKMKIENRPTKEMLIEKIIEWAGTCIIVWLLLQFLIWYLGQVPARLL